MLSIILIISLNLVANVNADYFIKSYLTKSSKTNGIFEVLELERCYGVNQNKFSDNNNGTLTKYTYHYLNTQCKGEPISSNLIILDEANYIVKDFPPYAFYEIYSMKF